MYQVYTELYNYITNLYALNTHSHHAEDSFFTDFTLDKVLKSSYVDWCGVSFEDTRESREKYLDKVRYKSFFRELQKSLKILYDMEDELTADNWDEYSGRIRESHKNPGWQLKILKENAKYEKVILDAYWNPGSKDGHPELFTSTFRVDSLFFGYDKEAYDHDGNNAYKFWGNISSNIDEYMEFVYELIRRKIGEGSVCLKNAIPYDRNVYYQKTRKSSANKVFLTKDYTEEDVIHFQDYFFNEVCKIAGELRVPVQCHTGMGCLENTRAMNMLCLIRENPGTKFSLMHGSFPWGGDILAYLDLHPNVYADVCWMPMLSPTYAEDMLHKLIEVGTSDRVVWGCDTWNSEESFAARLQMNEVLTRVLEKKVRQGYFSMKDAEYIAERIMHDNAEQLFNLSE